MKKRLFLLVMLVCIISLTALASAQLTHPGDRVWQEMPNFLVKLYEQEFLKLPKTNVGFVDVILDQRRPQDGHVVVMVDIRDQIAVFFFRGVPGGNGFVLPETLVYSDMAYILEIRWLDKTSGQWKYWFNRKKLFPSLLARPELYPQAENSPF